MFALIQLLAQAQAVAGLSTAVAFPATLSCVHRGTAAAHLAESAAAGAYLAHFQRKVMRRSSSR
jgi:hypothetical protein